MRRFPRGKSGCVLARKQNIELVYKQIRSPSFTYPGTCKHMYTGAYVYVCIYAGYPVLILVDHPTSSFPSCFQTAFLSCRFPVVGFSPSTSSKLNLHGKSSGKHIQLCVRRWIFLVHILCKNINSLRRNIVDWNIVNLNRNIFKLHFRYHTFLIFILNN